MRLASLAKFNSLGLSNWYPHNHWCHTLLFGLWIRIYFAYQGRIVIIRVSLKHIIPEEDYRVALLQELEFLEKKQQSTLNHIQGYQNIMIRRYNKRVDPCFFEVGDIVLNENHRNLAEHEKPGKFEPNGLGPFVITKVVGNNTYHL